jgi:hypothetical protein
MENAIRTGKCLFEQGKVADAPPDAMNIKPFQVFLLPAGEIVNDNNFM